MSWQHGLFRLWLLGTAAWMTLWAVMVGMACQLLPDGKMTCRTVSNHWIAEWIDRTTWSYFKIGLVGFSLPSAASSSSGRPRDAPDRAWCQLSVTPMSPGMPPGKSMTS